MPLEILETMEAMTNDFEERYLQKLNPQQREAATAVDGSVLLLATPGSGKTFVLVTRLGYMVRCRGIAPERILTMTYTNAATDDMRERFASLFGAELAERMQFQTINGVSSKIVSYASRRQNRTPPRLQNNEAELAKLIREIYQSVNKDYAEESVVKDIRTSITYIKNMMLTEEQIASLETNVDRLPEIYCQYQAALRGSGMMDYDDQMVYALFILRKNPKVLKHYQERYPYICVDEAQDTSKIQHEIIKLLAAGSGNLFMVGDEDQSIYGFRAAYPEALLSFEADHPGAKVLLMEDNYRSTPEIIDLANRFVAQNQHRHEKSIRATRESRSPVHVIQCQTRELQYALLLEMARSCDRETAVLFRNNDSALPLIDLLNKNGLDYNGRKIEETFFTHRVVTDLLGVLRLAQRPDDGALFMKLYYKFGARISRKDAEAAARRSERNGRPVLEELQKSPDASEYLKSAAADLMKHLNELKTDSAETAIHRVWNGMGYGDYVKNKGLDAGKFFILTMLAKDVPSTPALLEKLDALREAMERHTNSENTRLILSTIHSSKGLEYDRVYLLDVLDGIIPTKGRAELKTPDDEKQHEEERRLYYVGMTRAKNELYLFSFGNDAAFTEESRAYLPREAFKEDDVFSFLQTPMLGKTYADREYGTGRIVAQCEDTVTVRFPDRTLRSFTLQDMLSRREKRTALPDTRIKQERVETKRGTPISATEIKVGAALRHRKFGVGTVTAMDNGLMTVEFEAQGTKRFGIKNSLQSGFFEKV